MVDSRYKLEKQREEVLSKVGYIGRVFGSGEDAFHVVSPLIGAVFGYFVKK